MARYFFDIHDSGSTFDETGVECDTLDEVRLLAITALPDVAREQIPKDGDRRTFTVLVTGEDGRAVYTATLNFTGQWLSRERRPAA